MPLGLEIGLGDMYYADDEDDDDTDDDDDDDENTNDDGDDSDQDYWRVACKLVHLIYLANIDLLLVHLMYMRLHVIYMAICAIYIRRICHIYGYIWHEYDEGWVQLIYMAHLSFPYYRCDNDELDENDDDV